MVLEEEAKQRKEKDKLQRKVVIRKLPPTFTKEDFLNAVEPLAEYNYFSFIPAERGLGIHAYSRAYINFINPEDVFVFRDQFDGYVFVNEKGHEFPAIVEYAPFQKIPKQTKQRPDPRCGTIDVDEEYLEFLEMLKTDNSSTAPQIESMLEEIEKQEKLLKAASGSKTKTPLLEYVEQRASEKQRMVERRRKKDIEGKKSREGERKKRKGVAKKREEAYKEERERLRLKKDQKEKAKRDTENDREKYDEPVSKEIKHGETVARKERSFTRQSPKGVESIPVKTKRYSEVRKREEREKRPKVRQSSLDTSKSSHDVDFDSGSITSDKMDLSISDETTSELLVINETEETSQAAYDGKDRSRDVKTGSRIRNKDRPDMQLYRPGQSRLKTSTKTSDIKEGECSSSSSSPLQELSESYSGEQDVERSEDDRQDEDSNHQVDSAKKKESEKVQKDEEKVSSGRSGRKGFSYQYDREDRKMRSTQSNEEGSQYKSKTFRRSGQES